MLLGRDGFLGCRLAFHDLRQTPVVVAVTRIIAALFIDPDKTVEQHDLTGRAQTDLAVGACHIDRRAFEPGRRHLARQRALPDQIVQFGLIAIAQRQPLGIGGHIRRANAFMRLLGVFGLVFIDPRARGHIIRAVAILDRVAGGVHRLGRHVDAVGAHVGDVPGLVEPLRHLHRLARAEPELAAGFLL